MVLALCLGAARLFTLMDELDGDGGAGGGGIEAPAPSTSWTPEKLKAVINEAVKAGVEAAQKQPEAPAVHGADGGKKAPTIDELMKMVRDEVGASVADAMKASREAAHEALGRSTKTPFEITDADRARAEALKREERGEVGMLCASFMGWLARSRENPENAYKRAKAAGPGVVDPRVLRALGESQASTGGVLVPTEIANDYIELLRKESVFLAAGPRRIKLAHGHLQIPKVTGGATPTWVGESQNGTLSQPTFGDLNITLRKLMVLVPSSNELMDDAGPEIDTIIRDDLASAAAETIDAACLRGVGTQFQPRGLRQWASAGTTYAANATPNVVNVTVDTAKVRRLLRDRKVKMRNMAVFMSPRSEGFLLSARDGNNNLVWAAEALLGRYMGMRLFVTQNIPDNLGAGADSEIIYADMDQVIYAEDQRGLQIEARDGVAYYDGTAVQAAYSRDEIVFRMKQRVDVVVRQSGNEVVVQTGVTQA